MEHLEIRQDIIYTESSRKVVIVVGINGIEKQILVDVAYCNEQVQSGPDYTTKDWVRISKGREIVVKNDNYIKESVSTWDELESFVKKLGFDIKTCCRKLPPFRVAVV